MTYLPPVPQNRKRLSLCSLLSKQSRIACVYIPYFHSSKLKICRALKIGHYFVMLKGEQVNDQVLNKIIISNIYSLI